MRKINPQKYFETSMRTALLTRGIPPVSLSARFSILRTEHFVLLMLVYPSNIDLDSSTLPTLEYKPKASTFISCVLRLIYPVTTDT